MSAMAWYFAMVSVLGDGRILVDAMRTANEEQCLFEVKHLRDSPLDSAASWYDVSRVWWFWRYTYKELRTPYTMASSCGQFDGPPTVVVDMANHRVLLTR